MRFWTCLVVVTLEKSGRGKTKPLTHKIGIYRLKDNDNLMDRQEAQEDTGGKPSRAL